MCVWYGSCEEKRHSTWMQGFWWLAPAQGLAIDTAHSTDLPSQQKMCRRTDSHLLFFDILRTIKEWKQGLGVRAAALCFLDVTFWGVQTSSSYSLSCFVSKERNNEKQAVSSSSSFPSSILLLWSIHVCFYALGENSSHLAVWDTLSSSEQCCICDGVQQHLSEVLGQLNLEVHSFFFNLEWSYVWLQTFLHFCCGSFQ